MPLFTNPFHHHIYIVLLNDTQPTRYGNILDLFLTTNPTLVEQVSCQPGLSDHDVVIAQCALKPTVERQKTRKVPAFRKADWPKLESLMTDYQTEVLEQPHR